MIIIFPEINHKIRKTLQKVLLHLRIFDHYQLSIDRDKLSFAKPFGANERH